MSSRKDTREASQLSSAAAKRAKAVPGSVDAPTIGVDELLDAGSDAAFRDFVADLFAAASSMQHVRRALGRATGLSGSEIAMLLAIRRLSASGTVGVRAIADHLRVAGPHVTTEIGKLVEAGLLSKQTSTADNRAVDIKLTTEGRRHLRRLTPLVRAANDVLFDGMSRQEMLHVHEFLRRVVATAAEAAARVEKSRNE